MARASITPPLLIGLAEVQRQIGGLGKTATYDFFRDHGVPTVKIGGRSVWRYADIESAVAKLSEAPVKAAGLDLVQQRKTRRVRRGDRPDD